MTVVTACLPSAADHLEAAADSVRRARESLDIQWILVFDGPAESEVPDGPDLVMEMTRRRGVSVARNFALPNAQGEFLVNLDADDELDADGLLAGITTLQ